MENVTLILQLVAAAGIFNVWIFRFHKGSSYRGRSAKNMREEFAAYGLPPSVMWTVGALKLACATALVVGLWIPSIILPAASLLALLMVAALGMHLKVKDPLTKSVPAFAMLVLCGLIILL